MDMCKIDPKYLIPLAGKYNAIVFACNHGDCYCNLIKDNRKYGGISENIIGFAESKWGTMMVIECPRCFKKWYCHCRIDHKRGYYKYFLESIKHGLQKHFKS